MNAFFSSLFAEMAARRRRLREIFGDRGQGFFDFLILGGVLIGSLGLFVRPWMLAAAPWGLVLPLLFVAGYLLIEVRRQKAVRAHRHKLLHSNAEEDRRELEAILDKFRGQIDFDEEDLKEARARFEANTDVRWRDRSERADEVIAASGIDWLVLLWSVGCALLGAAAFVIAWTAAPPPPPQEEIWTPPENTVSVDISP